MKKLISLFGLLLLCSWSVLANIVPAISDRRLDATTALQSAFDESGKTGEPVTLRGFYWTSQPLQLRGGTIDGQLESFALNWTAEQYASVGNAVIYAKHAGDALVLSNHPTTSRAPVVRGLAIVCFHQSRKALDSAGIRVTSKTAPTVTKALVDAAGVGILLEGGSLQHRFNDVYIRSPRTAGIRTLQNSTVGDGRFDNVYVNGRQHPDYVPNPPETPPTPVGIDGVPISSSWHGRTLVEECVVAVRTGTVLNQYFDDLMVEALDTGIEVGSPYARPEYLRELHIARLHLQAGPGKTCVAWRWAGTNPQVKTTVRLGQYSLSAVSGGSWPNASLRPAQIVFLPFQQ